MVLGFKCPNNHEWVENDKGENEKTGSIKFSGKCPECGKYATTGYDLEGTKYD